MCQTYKLLCLDLDGTLLDNQKRVSDKAKQCLYKAKNMGIEIALLSGRMVFAIELIEKQIGFSCIKAASAGTYIVKDDKCISSKTLSPESVMNIYKKYALANDIPLWIYQGREWYVTKRDWYVDYEADLIERDPIVTDINTLYHQWIEEKNGPNKILFGARPDIITQIKNDMTEENMTDIDFARSTEMYLEIYSKGADKGDAALRICEVLGITPSEMMAIGDQELDVPMLQVAGYSVAMGNSPDKIKAMADFVTKSNEEDGVAYAMERLLF